MLNPYDIGTVEVPFSLPGAATIDSGTIDSGFNSPTIVTTLIEAKAQVFHYVLIAHTVGECGPSGGAEFLGNDIFLTLGCGFGPIETTPGVPATSTISSGTRTNTVGYPKQLQGTLIHEFGHNGGLKHGGPDTIEIVDAFVTKPVPRLFPRLTNDDANTNCKPNYPSAMSYSRQFPTFLGSSNWTPDLSEGKLPQLVETSLSETTGLPSAVTFNPPGVDPVFFPAIVFYAATGGTQIGFTTAGTSVDWSGDDRPLGTNDPPTDDPVGTVNVNHFPTINGCDGAGVTYNDYDDWNNMILDIHGASGNSFDGVTLIEFEQDPVTVLGSGELGPWFELLFFNTLEPGERDPFVSNTVTSGDRVDITGSYLSCKPNNVVFDSGDSTTFDICIDTTGSVKRQGFYDEILNGLETFDAANVDPDCAVDPASNECDANELFPLSGLNDPAGGTEIVGLLWKSGDGFDTAIELRDPAGRSFHEVEPGVYSFSLNTDGLAVGEYALLLESFANGVSIEEMFDEDIFPGPINYNFVRDGQRATLVFEVVAP